MEDVWTISHKTFQTNMNDLKHLEGGDFTYHAELNATRESYHAQNTDPVNVTFGDEYDYDIEESLNTFFWDELLPTLFVYTLTFILGLVGNILIIFTTFSYRKMKSTTNVFLASLASADLLLIVFCIPVKIENSAVPNEWTWLPAPSNTPHSLIQKKSLSVTYLLSADILLSNKFSSSDITQEPDLENNGTCAESEASLASKGASDPPPIFINGLENIRPLLALLGKKMKNEYSVRVIREGQLKLQITHSDNYSPNSCRQ